MIVRENAKSLSLAQKQAFTGALIKLKKLPSRLHPDDNQHSRYDDYVEIHFNAMMAMMIGQVPNWGHLSAAFCPWHRVLLHHFESELQAIDGSVALPYWDWTDADSTSAVFSSDLLGGNGRAGDGKVMDGPFAFDTGNWKVIIKDDDTNPDFLQRRLGADGSARALPDKNTQDPVMALATYDEAPWYDSERRTLQLRNRADDLFRFRLEYDLHNLVHRYVGGDMGLASSPNDPVFWMHHCNLDRLWSIWEHEKGKTNPYEPDHNGPDGQSGDKPLIFHFQNSMAPWIGDSTPSDVYDSQKQLGVGYETDKPETTLLSAARVAALHQMPMSANDMYPLRSEFHEATTKRMFPLRAEFKTAR
jgi:tyrosinase